MLTALTIIFIHTALCTEIAQGPPVNEHSFSLRGGKTIVVRKFEFSGNSGITTTQLERLTNPYLNHSLSESNISEIKLRIEILYRSKGYSGVQVTIPPMKSEDTLTFVIKEGKKQS
ncbi:MAG: hypothetical protein JSS30_05380 [Verrucomicrobia bacterium]|nr:hypothetical protein [Verrucomicrobiota bacterium]